MATRNSQITDTQYSNGNTSGSKKSYTDYQGVHTRARVSRDDF